MSLSARFHPFLTSLGRALFGLTLVLTVLTCLAQQKTPTSPFEEIEETPGAQTPLERALEAQQLSSRGNRQTVEAVEFRGIRRIPRDSLLARIFTRPGDPYEPEALRRDFHILWNTGYFDDLHVEAEDGQKGKIVRFVVVERRVVRTIQYEGVKSASISDILERFQERKVGLSIESRYDPTRVQLATVVLKELLAERGHQYAQIDPQVRQIPPSSVSILFQVDEGPKVKVGKIEFDGNRVLSDRTLRNSMKNLRPLGIPKSFVLENLFAKTFDARKLEEDQERIRNAYQEQGYFKASVYRNGLTTRDSRVRKLFPIPFVFPKTTKRMDIDLAIEEGAQYRLRNMSFTDASLFRTPDAILAPLFKMERGDIFNVARLRDGLENLKKLYGEFGYIDFVAEPNFQFLEDGPNGTVDLNFALDEGKQFFVRRINFSGNTTTRDKVIRRELFVDEGDMFNTRLWDMSILRLNQLGYFEPLKEAEATEIRRDPRNGLVDLTLNVRERGKNTVALHGGVSGFAGSFVGFGYQTSNFLGLGETLSFDAQLGTRERVLMAGFTEPYLFDRPIQAGFTVFTRRFSFNQAREASIFSGQNLIPLYDQLGRDNLLDYRQASSGFTAFVSHPFRKTFSRVSLTYSYQRENIVAFTESAKTLFEFLNFQGVSGPNSLDGIITSEITPAWFYNTVDHPITPTSGKSLYVSLGIAGLGGTTRSISPTVEAKYFRPMDARGGVLAMRFLTSLITGFSGQVPTPTRRAYMGGENDIRGFDLFSLSPMVWIPDVAEVPVLNSDGSERQQVEIVDGVKELVPVTMEAPVYRLAAPGGDTRMVYNIEYRIPLAGPVTLAPFFDIGFNKILFSNQVRLNEGRVDDLNLQFPQAGFTDDIEVIQATQKVRASTGLELQVMMPVLNAPFRFYWAYNPLRVRTTLTPPIAADSTMFPNYATFVGALSPVASPLAFAEDASTFRFTISRTF